MIQGRGVIYCDIWPRPRMRRSLARRITWEGGFTPIVSTGKNTATVTSKITIMYGFLIPLGLLNRTPPITEPCMEWGRRPEKNIGGIQGSPRKRNFGAEKQGEGDGQYFQPWPWSDLWKRRWKKLTKILLKSHSLGHPGGGRGV